MVSRVATSRQRVVCVVGVAGSGKTTAAHALATAFTASGVTVIGAAPSGVAAEKLQDETGIRSTTLHRLLGRIRQGEVPRRCVLIVDEAGMAETRVLAPVLEHMERLGGKVVLIGDPHQLPAVGAGGLFVGIVERHEAVPLHESRRQRDEMERCALAKIRTGVGRDYLAFAEQRDRLVVSDDPLAARMRLVADWWRHARSDVESNVMSALRRRDVGELNVLARGLMDKNGRLGSERLTVIGREFAAGDRVVCLRNSDRLGVKNGTRGTIARVNRTSSTLIVTTDRGDEVELDRPYLEGGRVRHAYALTGHSGQGLTVDRAFVLGSDEARLREWGYVALSRAREATRLYATTAVAERESDFHELDDRSPVSRVARALEDSAVERDAIDQQPHEGGPRDRDRAELERSPLSVAAQLRNVAREQLVLRRTRDGAAVALVDAERRIARLRRPGRQRREALRHQSERLRAAVSNADSQLQELDKRALRLRITPPDPNRGIRPRRSSSLGLDL